jgi:GH18 family chitinase
LGFVALSGCSKGGTLPLAEKEPTMALENSSSAFRIIGYAPEWDTLVQEIQFDKLTHINYAFAKARQDFGLEQPQS